MSMQIALVDLSGHKIDIDRNVKEDLWVGVSRVGVRMVNMDCICVQNCLKAYLVNEVC